MRITLDPHVVARLEKLRETRSFEDFLNEVLRAGLDTMERVEPRYTIRR